eukprot:TRINITY_DN6923_c0_g3_i2.p4 TRINITY_DN6923_c0_g3~~TRINITY_DN6923_c0_g3_i2.p4  ORF type:complete len:140 (+),score=7.53 TRINITY_DN6923_c0_g3_i2:770-1189(+)
MKPLTKNSSEPTLSYRCECPICLLLCRFSHQRKKISPNSFLYSLISSFSGSVSTVISCVTLYPLQTVRTRVQQSILQSDHLKGKRVNALKIGGKMLRKEGFKGMYKGLIPCLTKSVPSSAIFFYCYESISNSLNRLYAH